jgi:CHAT domain-containing protein
VKAAVLLSLLIGAVATNGSHTYFLLASARRADSWGNATVRTIAKRAYESYTSGRLEAAEREIQAGLAEAKRTSERSASIRFLSLLGGVQLQQFRFREAAQTYLSARETAASVGDWEEWVAASLNLSSVYDSMHQREAGALLLSESVERARLLNRPYFQGQLLVRLAEHTSDSQKRIALLNEAIEQARSTEVQSADDRASIARLRSLEALAWTHMGATRLRARDLAGAERALLEGFRIRTLWRSPELPYSRYWLAQWALEAGDVRAARLLHDAASGSPLISTDLLLLQDAKILAVEGRAPESFEQFRRSQQEMLRRRAGLGMPDLFEASSDASGFGAAEGLTRAPVQGPVLAFVQWGASQYRRKPDPKLAAELLAAVEENRGFSLELLRRSRRDAHPYPPAYWEALARYRRALTRSLSDPSHLEDLERQRLRLAEIEIQTGVTLSADQRESFLTVKSLTPFEGDFGGPEALFSFLLGEEVSYRWTVADGVVDLAILPRRSEIEDLLNRWKEMMARRQDGVSKESERLYRILFGNAPSRAAQKQRWVVIADGCLWEAPLAALVTGHTNGLPRYLAESHTLTLAARRPTRGWRAAAGRMLAVGDPIYNSADSRQPASSGWGVLGAATEPVSLPRLAGTAIEIERVAKGWPHGATVVVGANATADRVRQELNRRPGVVHVAAHIVAPLKLARESAIALSLNGAGSPDLLTQAEIQSLGLDGTLVVLNGCSSGKGELRHGAGVVGLVRSFLVAGASGVVSSYWPVPDDQGGFFEQFYGHLRVSDPAEALRNAQLWAIHSETWRAEPRFWSAYSFTEGVWREQSK